jgi:hypothetical protein
MTCGACGASELCVPCIGKTALQKAYEQAQVELRAGRRESKKRLREFAKAHPELARVAYRAEALIR